MGSRPTFYMYRRVRDVNRREIEEATLRLAGPVARSLGLEVLDTEFLVEAGRRILRVTIYRPEGITLDDCEAMDRAFGEVLDREDPIEGSYNLEISSPGLERTLRRDREFEVFAGRRVQVNLFAPVDGKRQFEGTLVGLREGEVVVDTSGGRMAFARESVSRVKLMFKPGEGGGRH